MANTTKYILYRSTSKNTGYKKIGSTTRLSFSDSNLKANKLYYYKVKTNGKVKGKTVNSAYSNLQSATTDEAKADYGLSIKATAKLTASATITGLSVDNIWYTKDFGHAWSYESNEDYAGTYKNLRDSGNKQIYKVGKATVYFSKP